MIYNIASFLFFVQKGRGADFVRAKWHASKGFKKALGKRRQVQTSRKVSDKYIWSLFEKERMLDFCCGYFRFLKSNIAAATTVMIATAAPAIHMGKASVESTVMVTVSVAMLPAVSLTVSAAV